MDRRRRRSRGGNNHQRRRVGVYRSRRWRRRVGDSRTMCGRRSRNRTWSGRRRGGRGRREEASSVVRVQVGDHFDPGSAKHAVEGTGRTTWATPPSHAALCLFCSNHMPRRGAAGAHRLTSAARGTPLLAGRAGRGRGGDRTAAAWAGPGTWRAGRRRGGRRGDRTAAARAGPGPWWAGRRRRRRRRWWPGQWAASRQAPGGPGWAGHRAGLPHGHHRARGGAPLVRGAPCGSREGSREPPGWHRKGAAGTLHPPRAWRGPRRRRPQRKGCHQQGRHRHAEDQLGHAHSQAGLQAHQHAGGQVAQDKGLAHLEGRPGRGCPAVHQLHLPSGRAHAQHGRGGRRRPHHSHGHGSRQERGHRGGQVGHVQGLVGQDHLGQGGGGQQHHRRRRGGGDRVHWPGRHVRRGACRRGCQAEPSNRVRWDHVVWSPPC